MFYALLLHKYLHDLVWRLYVMFTVFCAGNKYVFWAKTEEEASMALLY